MCVCVCAQNLVLNSSFEDTITCPNSTSQIYYSQNWFEPYFCSSDYFNICNSNIVSLPTNYVGFQYAEQGNAYAGIVVYNTLDTNFREFIETPDAFAIP